MDRKLGPLYLSFNPTVGRSLHGVSSGKGFEFSPNFKVSYDITPQIAGGVEYYASLGPVTGFDPWSSQQHQIFPTVDLNVSERWELNLGVGVGLTSSTDHLILKAIVGYRFGSSPRTASSRARPEGRGRAAAFCVPARP